MPMSRIITITSGKGGVGKTNISLNLALHLSTHGYRVCLFDADLGLGNINILLGIQPEYDLSDVILNGRNLEDIIIKIQDRVHILPASSGLEEMANLEADQTKALIESLSKMNKYDFLLFDTSAGISKNVISFCLASPEVVLVITPEPTSLTDSFALLKILRLNGFTGEAKLIINQCKNTDTATLVYRKFKSAAVKYLGIDLSTLGMIYQDPKVVEAVRQQRPFLTLYPLSNASKCIRQMGDRLLSAGRDELKEVDMVSFWSRSLQLIKSPVSYLSSKKERERHTSEPLLQRAGAETQRTKQQDQKGHLPDSPLESAATPRDVSDEKSAGAMNPEQALVPIMEKLIRNISSLSKEVQLLRGTIEGHKKSLGPQ